jgi:hypothetical protein
MALVSGENARRLREAGLERARVLLHSARRDAHDWLVGKPGTGRKAILAMRTSEQAGLAVEVEGFVTRPTMPHLAETIALVADLGVREVHLRALDVDSIAANDVVLLAPRAGLLQKHLEDAAAAADEAGVGLFLHGFPTCVAGSAARRCVLHGAERWIAPAAPTRGNPPRPRIPCASCPGAPACAGVDARYTEFFGWREIESLQPVSRAGRPNAIRIAFGAPAKIACPACGDHDRTEQHATRAVRRRLVRAAQEGAPLLLVTDAGSLAHPEAAALLAETGLLSFPRVEVAGEAAALAGFLDQDMRRLAHLARFDAALYGPDARRHDAHVGRAGSFEDAIAGVRRLAAVAAVPVGAYAVLHDESDLLDYGVAWSRNELPGDPSFRLSERGGSLGGLARAAAAIPAGAARDAISRVLPPCLLTRPPSVSPAASALPAFVESPGEAAAPSGSDPRGTFESCPVSAACAAAAACPGLARGWSHDGIRPVEAEGGR